MAWLCADRDPTTRGDFKKCLCDHNGGVGNLTMTFGLQDITCTAIPMINFATCGRGTKRIDCTIGTSRFHKALIGGGHKPFGEHCQSDHRLFHLEFDNALLFGNKTSDTVKRETRVQHSDKTQGLAHMETLCELTQSRDLCE